MQNYSVSCIIYVRGVGEPDYVLTLPAETISDYGEVEAIDTYLNRLLDDRVVFPHLEDSYLIVPHVHS